VATRLGPDRTYHAHHCRLKAYIVLTFWAEKVIFAEYVRQNAADPDQIWYTWTGLL